MVDWEALIETERTGTLHVFRHMLGMSEGEALERFAAYKRLLAKAIRDGKITPTIENGRISLDPAEVKAAFPP